LDELAWSQGVQDELAPWEPGGSAEVLRGFNPRRGGKFPHSRGVRRLSLGGRRTMYDIGVVSGTTIVARTSASGA
jgi:hypothetical protein